MQADVSCIMRILGFVPPSELSVMTTPIIHLLESNPTGNFIPPVVSKGEETCITDLTSYEPRPPGTSPVCHEFASQNRDSPNLRQCPGLKSATSSSTGGNTAENQTNYTEGLARALSNYNLVIDTSRQTAHGGNGQTNLAPTNAVSGGYEPVIMENEETRSLCSTYNQDFKGIVRSRQTGFKVCRPPGTFIWPSMMNISQFNPNFASMNPKVLEVIRADVTGSGSARTSGYSSLTSGISCIPTNTSTRSIAESQVAATMAGMFGCMAPQQSGGKFDTQVPGNVSHCVLVPGTGHTSHRANHNIASKVGHTGSPGVQQQNAFPASTRIRAEPPPGQMQGQRTPPLSDPTKYPPRLSSPHLRHSRDASPPALPTLPLMTRGVETGGMELEMEITPHTADFSSIAHTSSPACSLSLSLSLGSSTPGIHCDNLNALKKQKSIWWVRWSICMWPCTSTRYLERRDLPSFLWAFARKNIIAVTAMYKAQF